MGDVEQKRSKASMIAMQPSQHRGSSSTRVFGVRSMSRTKVRKHSHGFISGVPAIRNVEKTSQVGFEFKRPPLIYLPTFQLDPHEKFHLEKVTKVVERLIDGNFTGHKYSVTESPALALRLAGEVMREVKAMDFKRHRLVSVVTIGQKRAQSFNNAVAFLWDHERDNYVEAHRETATAFIQITLFAIYLD